MVRNMKIEKISFSRFKIFFLIFSAQDFKPCNHDDDTCLNGLANNFWNTRYMGDPQIGNHYLILNVFAINLLILKLVSGLDPLDPLLIKNVISFDFNLDLCQSLYCFR